MGRFIAVILLLLLVASHATAAEPAPTTRSTDDGSWFCLSESALKLGPHHTRHLEVFGRSITGYNRAILAGVDRVQASQPDGGGYFTGIHAQPPESPIGYELKLLGRPLLTPPRTTSYCSGSSYTAFIEALNLIFGERAASGLSADRFEAMRMQEPDGGRREDGVKMWGHWNDDGFGTHYALVQYAGGAGMEIKPNDLRPGDFLNISWKSGLGHSVVFLGWHRDASTGIKQILFWSSQKGTNGLGDLLVPIDRIKDVKCVRLIDPGKLFVFDVNATVNRKIPGDAIDW
jgi:hypothetical protein